MSKEGRKGSCKSPSQEFREVLYKMYEKDAEGFEDFESFYNTKMNLLINHYRKKLNES